MVGFTVDGDLIDTAMLVGLGSSMVTFVEGMVDAGFWKNIADSRFLSLEKGEIFRMAAVLCLSRRSEEKKKGLVDLWVVSRDVQRL